MEKMKDDILKWFVSGEKGSSSEAMANALLGKEYGHKNQCHPFDPSDLNRCVKLLNAVPDSRNHMDKVAAISDAWSKLVNRWDEIEGMLVSEIAIGTGQAPKTYDLMQEVLHK